MSEHDNSRLVRQYVDGTASTEDMNRLNERLLNSPGLRYHLIEELNLDSALAAVCETCEDEDLASTPAGSGQSVSVDQFAVDAQSVHSSPSTRRQSLLRLVAVAVCTALLITGSWWWQSSQRAWATVQSRFGVGKLAKGTELRHGTYEIDAGVVQLVTAQGVIVVIEAPAEFRFESPGRLAMTRGRLSADVPPAAVGFTVVTPSGEAVDLGTRFGVDVHESSPAEIHVFEGEVIAKATGATTSEHLRQGDAVRMNAGASAAREIRSSAFIQTDEMSELSTGITSAQRKLSEELTASLKQDPALIALLDFESNSKRPGTFRMTQGRWPASQAPEFVDVGDHMPLVVGGDREWRQLTLAAWVRLDQLGAPYQSLLHTNGWGENLGQVHWMVTRHNTMRLALFGNTLAEESSELESYPDSKTSVLPEQGRWVHFATVYDSTARTVRFYLNGEFDKETKQGVAYPARLGSAQIGNWDRQDRKLSGRIDELLLMGRTLSDAEIRNLYVAGNPYR